MNLFSFFDRNPPDDDPAIGACPCSRTIGAKWQYPWCPGCGVRFDGELLAAFRDHHPRPVIDAAEPVDSQTPAPVISAEILAQAKWVYGTKVALSCC